MKLVLPTKKYILSYFELIDSAINNGDYSELGHAGLRNNESFDEMRIRLRNRKKGIEIHRRDVPSCVYWIIDNDIIVGTIDMRYTLNKDYYERFGHVAYYIKKEERNKKYATKALKLVINNYKKLNIEKILITCLENNEASKNVIINNNGILEKKVFDEILKDTILKYIIKI